MASVLAIVSKAVFEKMHGTPGQALPIDRYDSTHKALDALAAGGAIFLVTVRPPDEALWLVAIVEGPARGARGWAGTANTTPITDITALRSRLRFSTGAGIQAKPGALGMSLQTPRGLTDEDVALLRGATGGKASAVRAKVSAIRTKASVARTEPSAAVAEETGGRAAVAAALAARDTEAALRAALAWWRAVRDPAIADLVDAISARLSEHRVLEPLGWSKLARTCDPVVLGPLLASVPAMTGSFLPTAAALLAAFDADPRITAALGGWVADPPTTSSSTYPFWTKVLELAVTTGDVRAIAALKRRLAMPKRTKSQFWTKFYTAIERVIEKLEALPRPKASAGLAGLAAAAGKLPKLDGVRASGIVAAAAKKSEAPVLTGPLLAQAAQHLAAGRIETAIDAMLIHWRASRAPEVADLIDRASRLLPSWDRPLAPTEKAMHAAWSEAFATPGARMPQLLENLVVGAPKELDLRLVDLANLGDDPRISMRLAQLARNMGVSPERTQFWRSVFELLARHRDVRTFAPLLREFNGFNGRYYDHHRQAKRIFGPTAAAEERPALDAADARLAAKLATALAEAEVRARKTERALLAAIGDAPGDDGPRSVYADWLQEQGHPRGELVNLELVARRSPAEEARRAELAGTPYVFGVLHDVVGELPLVRGLPSTLAIEWRVGGLLWHALAAHPLLGVVETIDLREVGDGTRPTAADLAVAIAAAPRLTKIANAGESAAELAKLTPFVPKGRGLVRA